MPDGIHILLDNDGMYSMAVGGELLAAHMSSGLMIEVLRDLLRQGYRVTVVTNRG